MIELRRAFEAELLKTRRSPLVWLAVLLPVVASLVTYVMQYPRRQFLGSGASYWLTYTNTALTLWAILFSPVLVALLSGQIADLDHRESMWKHLFVQPTSRKLQIIAKVMVAALWLAAAGVVMAFLTFVAGMLLGIAAGKHPDAFPFTAVVYDTARVWMASWSILGISIWAALRSKSTAVPVILGLLGIFTVIGAGGWWETMIPWRWPTLAIEELDGKWPVLLGTIVGATVTCLCAFDVSRRDITN